MVNNPCSTAMVSLIQRQDALLREAERERLLRAAEPAPAAPPRRGRRGYRAAWRNVVSCARLLRPLGGVNLAR